ncbi:FAD-dependent oxidoreductase [Arthrobacter sp. MYb227]|uniref:NAD(P)/FAD-dependent oxidoreductase n=1 Tax=Arthrobacter sp. MYb227 TaxID=1848601 RepID=UPI000CFE2A81|nr:FAD-dependent oxidoreductase [Arthrobacter sp. MYb227]PQZ92846.1 FAD-dependent oxidoreductase [Arthrobacter sp. MYb227]
MSQTQRVVVVGGGLAGVKTAEALRTSGFKGSICIVAAEDQLPYERPPLSKGYLMGKTEFSAQVVHPEEWFTENAVELRRKTRVTAIDRIAKRVELSDGTRLHYDTLVLATGSRPRRIPLLGAEAQGVHYLRTKNNADALRSVFGEGKRVVFVGGGWIGLEVAAAARAAGCTVTILERLSLPLLPILGEEVAQVFADLHRSHGVDLHTAVDVKSIQTQDGVVTGVELGTGEVFPADAVVIAVGAIPSVELAQEAGLEVENGVLVDESLRSSDPSIFAVGDIANQQHPFLGRRLRVEHWATALNQPKTVAAAIMGEPASYTDLPYFFTDQYDLGMEYIGNAQPGSYDQVVLRGDLAKREFLAFWLSQGVVIAGMNVNIWDVSESIQKLIRSQKQVDLKKLADPSVALETL